MTRQNISSGGPYEAPYGYSRAVRVGDQVHVAGTCAQPPNVDGVDAYGQAVAALAIIEAALKEAGSGIADVVRTRIYVVDIDDTDAVLRAHGEVFGPVRPAATLVKVAALIDPLLLVEIEAYAVAQMRLVGYWQNEEHPEYPDANDFIDPSADVAELERVGSYLANGTLLRAYMGLSPCRVCGKPNGSAEYTDGTYVWPEGLAHYVRDHRVRLPAELERHALDQLQLQEERSGRANHSWWIAQTQR